MYIEYWVYVVNYAHSGEWNSKEDPWTLSLLEESLSGETAHTSIQVIRLWDLRVIFLKDIKGGKYIKTLR